MVSEFLIGRARQAFGELSNLKLVGREIQFLRHFMDRFVILVAEKSLPEPF